MTAVFLDLRKCLSQAAAKKQAEMEEREQRERAESIKQQIDAQKEVCS